jgi:hypothetical protein
MKGLVRCCALILVVSITAIVPGRAGSITYTANFGRMLPMPTLPGFDTSITDLDEVDFKVTGFVSGFWLSEVSPIASGTFNLDAETLLNNVDVGFSQTAAPFSYPAPQIFLFLDATFAVDSVLTSDLSMFYAPQTMTLSLLLNYYFTDIDPGVYPVGEISSWGGTETLTYIYGVPEPSGASMAGTASLIGLAFWLWRRMHLSSRQP